MGLATAIRALVAAAQLPAAPVATPVPQVLAHLGQQRNAGPTHLPAVQVQAHGTPRAMTRMPVGQAPALVVVQVPVALAPVPRVLAMDRVAVRRAPVDRAAVAMRTPMGLQAPALVARVMVARVMVARAAAMRMAAAQGPALVVVVQVPVALAAVQRVLAKDRAAVRRTPAARAAVAMRMPVGLRALALVARVLVALRQCGWRRQRRRW